MLGYQLNRALVEHFCSYRVTIYNLQAEGAYNRNTCMNHALFKVYLMKCTHGDMHFLIIIKL